MHEIDTSIDRLEQCSVLLTGVEEAYQVFPCGQGLQLLCYWSGRGHNCGTIILWLVAFVKTYNSF